MCTLAATFKWLHTPSLSKTWCGCLDRAPSPFPVLTESVAWYRIQRHSFNSVNTSALLLTVLWWADKQLCLHIHGIQHTNANWLVLWTKMDGINLLLWNSYALSSLLTNNTVTTPKVISITLDRAIPALSCKQMVSWDGKTRNTHTYQ
jgi:hypothetical protein